MLFRLIRNRCCNTPILVSFFKHVPNINEIPRSDNKHLIITQVNNLGVIIGGLHLLVVLIYVGIKRFLNLKIIQHRFIRLMCGVLKLKRVHKNISLTNLRVLTIQLERKWRLYNFEKIFLINVEYRWQSL